MDNELDASLASGDKAAPPAVTDDKKPASSPGNGAKPLNPIRDALDRASAKLKLNGKEDGPKETPPEEKTEAVEGETKADATQDEPGKGKETPEEAADVHSQFSKRSEWVETTKVLGEEAAKKVRPILRQMMERENRLQAQVQPLAEMVNEMKRHTGDEEGFKNARNLIKTYAEDPASAVPMLENLLLDAKQRAGLEFSSDDLKARIAKIDQRVQEGHLSQEDADEIKKDLREVEKSRAKVKQTDAQTAAQRQEAEQRRAQEFNHGRMKALNDWEKNVRGKETSFGSVTDQTDPKHGESVADQVFDAITGLFARKPDVTADELVAEANRMLGIAKGRLQPAARREQKSVTGRGPSVNDRGSKGGTWKDRLGAKLDDLASA